MAVERTETPWHSASDRRFATVHAIALRGTVTVLQPGGEELLTAGWVRAVRGGFELTEQGYTGHRRLLEHERATLDLSRLAVAYAPLPALARVLRQLRSGWRQPCGVLARRRLVAQMCGLADDTGPALRRAAVIAPRFASYLPRLTGAAACLRAGDHDFAFGTGVDSIGCVWQELHEDFLQTLGRAHELGEEL